MTTDPAEFSAAEAPEIHANAPEKSAIAYRYGTQATILQRLLSRLHQQETPGSATAAPSRPLQTLSIHDRDDPAIALLDSWAMVADVLSFYQERIANEGYLRTAIEDRSILELSRAIGYNVRPGVAATTPLVFTVEDAPGSEPQVVVPQGTQVQSIPTQPGEVPQTFETVEDFQARVDWNVLTPYLEQSPKSQPLSSTTTMLKVQGTNPLLQPGDTILIVGKERFKDPSSSCWYLGTLTKVEPNLEQGYTLIDWGEQPSRPLTQPLTSPQIFVFRQRTSLFGHNAPLTNQQLNSDRQIIEAGTGTISSSGTTITGNSTDFGKLHRGDIIIAGNQARTVMAVTSSNALTVEASFNPQIGTPTAFSYIRKEIEWSNFCVQGQHVNLDTVYPNILSDSWIALTQTDSLHSQEPKICRVNGTSVTFHSDFGLASKITRIETDLNLESAGFDLRKTSVLMQSEELKSFQELETIHPIESDGETIKLNPVAFPLKPGHKIIISSINDHNITQNDIVTVKEMNSDKKINSERTILTIAETLEPKDYKAETLKFYGNVVLATHGETIAEEVLGSGDGTKANQQFTLKKSPLTYTSSTTATGIQSTLKIYVNQVLWQPVQSLHNQDARSQCYMVQTNEQGQTRIIFGDGIQGARLPSGQENVRATYRSGIGHAGEVKAGSLILLQNRPLGIREVTNPLPAAGAADRDSFDTVRKNAPRTVLTLDHVVSLRDFENFARSFAGIGKAQATLIWTGDRRQVWITVADENGQKAPDNLCSTLRDAIVRAGSIQPVEVVSYKPEEAMFNVKAKVLIGDRYRFEMVKPQIEQALRQAFSFSQREFGQGVAASEVIQIIQSVEGVIAVDLDALYLGQPKQPNQPTPLESFIEAKSARWEGKEAKPAQILLLNSTAQGTVLQEWT